MQRIVRSPVWSENMAVADRVFREGYLEMRRGRDLVRCWGQCPSALFSMRVLLFIVCIKQQQLLDNFIYSSDKLQGIVIDTRILIGSYGAMSGAWSCTLQILNAREIFLSSSWTHDRDRRDQV